MFLNILLRLSVALFLFAFWFFGMAFFGAPKAGLIIGGVAAVLLMFITKNRTDETMQAPDLRRFVQTLKVTDEQSLYFNTNTAKANTNKAQTLQNKEGKQETKRAK